MGFRTTLSVTLIFGVSASMGCSEDGGAATSEDAGSLADSDSGGGGTGTGTGTDDDGGSSAVDDAGEELDFTPEPITAIEGTANTSFGADDVPITFNYGLIKALQPGDQGVEGRTFEEYEAYLLVLAEKPVGCEQEVSEWRTGARTTMYFLFNDDLPLGGIYGEVTWTDRHPSDPWNFNVNSASGNITGSLTDVADGVATGTVESTGAARTTFSGSFEVTVCD